jgi:hypothetical protein
MALVKFGGLSGGYIDTDRIDSVIELSDRSNSYECQLSCYSGIVDTPVSEADLPLFTKDLVPFVDTDGLRLWLKKSLIALIQDYECYFVITLSNGETFEVESIDSLQLVPKRPD